MIKVLQTSALPLGHVAGNKSGRLAACRLLERATRFELVAFSLARRRSTTELCPQRELLLTVIPTADSFSKTFFVFLQNNHELQNTKICQDPGSNWGHLHFQCSALPTELSRLLKNLVGGWEILSKAALPVKYKCRRRLPYSSAGKNGLWLENGRSLYNNLRHFRQLYT